MPPGGGVRLRRKSPTFAPFGRGGLAPGRGRNPPQVQEGPCKVLSECQFFLKTSLV